MICILDLLYTRTTLEPMITVQNFSSLFPNTAKAWACSTEVFCRPSMCHSHMPSACVSNCIACIVMYTNAQALWAQIQDTNHTRNKIVSYACTDIIRVHLLTHNINLRRVQTFAIPVGNGRYQTPLPSIQISVHSPVYESNPESRSRFHTYLAPSHSPIAYSSFTQLLLLSIESRLYIATPQVEFENCYRICGCESMCQGMFIHLVAYYKASTNCIVVSRPACK